MSQVSAIARASVGSSLPASVLATTAVNVSSLPRSARIFAQAAISWASEIVPRTGSRWSTSTMSPAFSAVTLAASSLRVIASLSFLVIHLLAARI